jgi:hypothetical protein
MKLIYIQEFCVDGIIGVVDFAWSQNDHTIWQINLLTKIKTRL